jgi:hypothetical protein
MAYTQVTRVHEREHMIHKHAIIQQVFQTAIPQTQHFREGHSTFRWKQTSTQLPFTASDYS